MVEITKAKTEDYEELVNTANYVFMTDEGPTDFPGLLPKLYAKSNDTMKYHHIIREDGKIKAIVGSFPAEMEICGERLKGYGIGTVSVHTDSRSKGYMKKLMKAALEEMERENTDFSFLGGQRQRYEHFGFTPCGAVASFAFTTENARRLPHQDGVYSFRAVSAEDTNIISQMFSLYQKRPAKVVRAKDDFYQILLTWHEVPEVILKGDTFMGYLVRNDKGDQIAEIELCDCSELVTVLKDYLKAHNQWSVTLDGVHLFETEKIKILSSCAEDVRLTNQEDYNILNYVKVLSAFLKLKSTYQPLCDGKLTVKIKDRQTVSITVKDQKVEVLQAESSDTQEDIEISHLEAMQIFFGAASVVGDFGVGLPPFARQWFPLPLFYNRPDQV